MAGKLKKLAFGNGGFDAKKGTVKSSLPKKKKPKASSASQYKQKKGKMY